MKAKRKPRQRQEAKPVSLTRAHVLARDWRNASTEDINRRIAALAAERNSHTEDLAHYTGLATEHRKALALAIEDIQALEEVVESRR